jgi:glycosyltransferase involved in cell wall biosynthesis
MTHSRDHVFIVVPAYNEMPVIETVLGELCDRWPNVIVVDDGSSDGTHDVACRLARWTLRHPINRGQGAALQTGIDFALARGASCIVTFDGDGQHRVDDLDRLVGPIVERACDVVLGSRFAGTASGLPPSRRLAIALGVVITRLSSGLRVTDTHNGLRAFSRRAAERIRITQDRMAHASELLDEIGRLGLPWLEVPVNIVYTDHSLAKGQRIGNAPRILLHHLIGRLVG